jgi:hypothetical protein
VIAKETAGDTVTIAVACKPGLAALVAIIVTEVIVVRLAGVKTPLLEICPALADQVTAVFAVPLTLAVKSCCPFEGMVALLGESEIVMLGLGGLGGVLGLLLETTSSKELEPDCIELDPDCVERESGPLCTGTGRGLSDTKSTDL